MSRFASMWFLATTASVLMMGLQVSRSCSARTEVGSSIAAANTASQQVSELNRLRSTSEQVIFGDPPADDFIEGVSDVLTSLGLPASVATNIAREADRASNAGKDTAGLRRRDMRIELRPISTLDLGRFLVAWREDYPAWISRQITLNKASGRNADPSDYHASITYSAEYMNPGANP